MHIRHSYRTVIRFRRPPTHNNRTLRLQQSSKSHLSILLTRPPQCEGVRMDQKMHILKRRAPWLIKLFSQIPTPTSSFQNTVDTGKDLILTLLEEKSESSLKEATIVWLQMMQVLVHSGIHSHNTEQFIVISDILNELMTAIVTTHAQTFPSYFPSWVQATVSQMNDIVTSTTSLNDVQAQSTGIELRDNPQHLLQRLIPYNEILSGLCKCSTIEAAHEAHILLQTIIHHENSFSYTTYSSFPKSTKLSTFSFNATLSCWLSAVPLGNVDVEFKLTQIWNPMMEIYKRQLEKNIVTVNVYPNRITVHMILSILRNQILLLHRDKSTQDSSLTTETAYLYAKGILQSMIQIYRDQYHQRKTTLPSALQDYEAGPTWSEYAWKPNPENFHTLLGIVGSCVGHGLFVKTQMIEILNWMKQIEQEFSDNTMYPDILIYKTIIGILLKTAPSHVDSTKRSKKRNSVPSLESDEMVAVMDIVSEATDRYGLIGNDHNDSSSSLGNYLVANLSKAGYPDEAYKVLRKMLEESSITEPGRAKVNTISWNAVMSSFAQMGNVDRAVHVLHEMQDYHAAGHEDVRPDNISMTILLKLLLQDNSPNIGEKAVLILERMENKAKEGYIYLKPDLVAYATVIECLLKSRTLKDTIKAKDTLMQRIVEFQGKMSDVRPDGRMFKRVTMALLDHFPDQLSSVNELLRHFESDGSINLDDASEMFDCYTSILHLLCTKEISFDSLGEAEKTLTRLEELHQNGISWIYPRTIHYNWLLDALAKQNNVQACNTAKGILSNMELRYKNRLTEMKPDSYSYASVMLAVANGSIYNSRASQAEALLEHILDITGEKKFSLQLSPAIFNNAIKAIERSGAKDKEARVKRILLSMVNAGVKPDIVTYNGAIRCCAYTDGSMDEKRRALDYAYSLLNELRMSDSVSVDLYSYPAIFIACDKLMSKSDDDLQRLKQVFRYCCEDGFLSDVTLSQLKKMKIPVTFLAELLQTDDPMSLRLESIPKRWTRVYYRRNKISRQ